jgi:hypothetical protein
LTGDEFAHYSRRNRFRIVSTAALVLRRLEVAHDS